MDKLVLVLFGVFFSTLMLAQEASFKLKASTDSLLLGNKLKLVFEMKDLNCQFEPPNLDAFNKVIGPHMSSTTSIINGQMNQSTSFTYYLIPEELGLYTIDQAFCVTDDKTFDSKPFEFQVLPNPDNIIVNPDEGNMFESFWDINSTERQSKSTKKKRKLKKI